MLDYEPTSLKENERYKLEIQPFLYALMLKAKHKTVAATKLN